MSKTPIAPYEVASNPLTSRKGKYLYLDGKKYRCPTISAADGLRIMTDIRRNLNICDNTCRGLTRVWHRITSNPGHKR